MRRGSIEITYPILRDSAIVTSAFLHFISAELENNIEGRPNYKGVLLIMLMQLALFFHPIVETMLITAAERPLSEQRYPTGRAFGIIQFGIIYGSLFVFFDALHVIEAIWMYTYIALAAPRSISRFVKHQESFQVLVLVTLNKMCAGLVGLALFAQFFRLPLSEIIDATVKLFQNASLVLLLVIAGNCIANLVQNFGERRGRLIRQKALRAAHIQRTEELQYEGALCFIVWVSILCAIVLI